MKVQRTSGSTGAWLKKDELKSGEPLKIVSEASLVEGQNGVQLVMKVRTKGSQDALNTAVNNTSKNALIDAFGEDTKDWVDQVVTAVTEKAIIAGKRALVLYLVPKGYELTDGEDGFMVIQRVAEEAPKTKKAKVQETADEDTREAPLPDDEGEEDEKVESPW